MGQEQIIDNGPDRILPTENFKTSDPDGIVRICSLETASKSEEPISVYSFFKQCAEKYKDQLALLVKRDEIWREWTYSEYFNDCCTVAKALIKLGLEKFHGVCIMGHNNPEWIISNFGAIFAGGLSSGVYTTNSPDACFTLADNCQAQIIIVENKTCLDKFSAVKGKLPHIKALIQWSGEPAAPDVLSWTDLMAIGAQEPDEVLQQRLSTAAINQCCTLIYTSGTTGPPKGVMLSQDQMTWIGSQFKVVYEGATDNVVTSYLPLSHLAAQIADIYSMMKVGATLYIAPSDALKGTLGALLLEVRPTVFLAVPRVWEKMYAKLNAALSNVGFIKKTLFSWAMYHSLNYYSAMQEGRELSSAEKWKYYAAKSLVLNKVKQAIGFDRAHSVVSGSAPLSTEVMEFFFSVDVPILEGYGLSESLGTCSLGLIKPLSFKIGSVGKIRDINEVMLKHTEEHKEEGEIYIRGRNVCMGYLRTPDKTDEAIDEEGWLHTGDLGWIDSDGFLFITGRLKELIITSGGENVPPIPIEDAVKKELPCISNAMLIGDKRKYLSILLTFKTEMNVDTGEPLQGLTLPCQSWLLENGCEAKTVNEAIEDIQTHPDGSLAQAIQEGINRYNRLHAISNAQRVQRWVFLTHDFSLPTGELNNTLKLKRSFVVEKYAHIIDTMYSKEEKSIF